MFPSEKVVVAVFPSFLCFHMFSCVSGVAQHVETRLQDSWWIPSTRLDQSANYLARHQEPNPYTQILSHFSPNTSKNPFISINIQRSASNGRWLHLILMLASPFNAKAIATWRSFELKISSYRMYIHVHLFQRFSKVMGIDRFPPRVIPQR